MLTGIFSIIVLVPGSVGAIFSKNAPGAGAVLVFIFFGLVRNFRKVKNDFISGNRPERRPMCAAETG